MKIRPSALENYLRHPVAFLIPCLALASLVGMLMFSHTGRDREAFLSSCSYFATVLSGAAVGLFPILLPSSTDAARDITISRAKSGSYTIVRRFDLVGHRYFFRKIAYFVFVYRMFAGKVRLSAEDVDHN